jgi:hypothetical protein
MDYFSFAPLYGMLLALPANTKFGWKGLKDKKLSSSLGPSVNHARKSFFSIDNKCQRNKTLQEGE